jgi:hypothetical protein
MTFIVTIIILTILALLLANWVLRHHHFLGYWYHPHDLALLANWALRHQSPLQFALDGLASSVPFFKEKQVHFS